MTVVVAPKSANSPTFLSLAPLSITQKRLNVNIADHVMGIGVNYTTPGELRKYTKATRRFYSREEAKSRGLAALLMVM